jgi:hypothetical protein
MVDDSRIRPVVRVHRNGMVGSVAFYPDLNAYSGTAARDGQISYPSRTRTLADAKAIADREAGCANCQCAPWGDFGA